MAKSLKSVLSKINLVDLAVVLVLIAVLMCLMKKMDVVEGLCGLSSAGRTKIQSGRANKTEQQQAVYCSNLGDSNCSFMEDGVEMCTTDMTDRVAAERDITVIDLDCSQDNIDMFAGRAGGGTYGEGEVCVGPPESRCDLVGNRDDCVRDCRVKQCNRAATPSPPSPQPGSSDYIDPDCIVNMVNYTMVANESWPSPPPNIYEARRVCNSSSTCGSDITFIDGGLPQCCPRAQSEMVKDPEERRNICEL